ncbi:solute:sodium symporter family transporter [Calycomorphotria hydatis]|uniref:Putative symporter YidK n=1 Tax=Calycomorphotria hydatis TaxID=2528027 RepID=A0A517T6X3_9PLAN|nr:solute:sodium symporter family transporter [Calycomorphotria hydatis]QDT64126.1 putative symporter YidK [Calycomorphotria hydatis]
MQELITLGSFLLCMGFVAVTTWWLTRRDDHSSSDGYFLAGRTLTAGYIAGSLLLTNLSTEQLVGLNGDAFNDGICVIAWEVVAAFSLVVLALVYLPIYLRSGIATVPQFLEERFGKTTRAITSFIFILAYMGILLPIILYTGSLGLIGILDLQSLTGIEDQAVLIWGCVWFIGIVGSIYAIFGGLRTVAVSDTLNGFGLLVGGISISIFGLMAMQKENIWEALKTLYVEHPEKFNSIGGPEQSVPFSTLFSGVLLLNMFYWSTNQQIIQRTLGAKSLADGQKGVLLAGFFKILAPFILVLPGIIAFHLYAADGIESKDAYGTLVRDVLPSPLTGFFAAVIVGAILSSYNSVLNSTATLFSLGVYKDILHPNADDKQVIRAGKIVGAITAVTAMSIAPLLLGQESIFTYLQKMNGLYFIPIFAVVLIGMFTKRVPGWSANIALLLGVAVIAAGYFVPQAAKFISPIHEFHFLGLVFAGLIGLMLIAGLIAPTATAWEQRDALAVDLTPWSWAWPVGGLLTLVVVAIYVAFADVSILIK